MTVDEARRRGREKLDLCRSNLAEGYYERTKALRDLLDALDREEEERRAKSVRARLGRTDSYSPKGEIPEGDMRDQFAAGFDETAEPGPRILLDEEPGGAGP